MKHFIITGKKHAGKTQFSDNLREILALYGISIGGFLCTGTFKNGQRDSFFIKSLIDNKVELFADKNENNDNNNLSFGSFTFYKKGFLFAKHEYEKSILLKRNVIFIDEIGRWEIEGGGFRELFNKIPVFSSIAAVCRVDFADEINSLFFNNLADIININDDILKCAEKIKNQSKGYMHYDKIK